MDSVDPVDVETSLAAYYDEEGDERLNRPMDPRRVAARDGFLATIATGGERCVLEIGSGPGRDAAAFINAGHCHIAVELSGEHARRCQTTGSRVIRASVRRLPFPTASFDSIWTMSTLMHVPDSAIVLALSEVTRVLKPGGVAAIGVWGGPDVEELSSEDQLRGREPRLFSRRSNKRWRGMLDGIGTVEDFKTWGDDHDFFYQWATVRRREC